MRLDYERSHCYAWDTHSWLLPRSADCGVLVPAARAECGVSSGAAEFGDVAGAAERGLEWFSCWRGALSGGLAAKAGAVVKILTDGQLVWYGIVAELGKVALKFVGVACE